MGLLWESETDTFRFDIDTSRPVRTKRQVLRESSSIFDPLGFIGPALILARILIQDTWRIKISWDEALPKELMASWNGWYEKLKALEGLRIPRCLQRQTDQPASYHVFCDASLKAFGAVVYARCVAADEVKIRFVIGKGRVAPLRPLSVTRLELQGAVIGCRLAHTIVEEL